MRNRAAQTAGHCGAAARVTQGPAGSAVRGLLALTLLVGLLSGLLGAGTAEAASGIVRIGAAKHALTGVNSTLRSDSLVAYTRARDTKVPKVTASHVEVVVVRGAVIAVVQRRQNARIASTIPAGGVVLAGRGTARSWLSKKARVGARVVLPRSVTKAIPVPKEMPGHGSPVVIAPSPSSPAPTVIAPSPSGAEPSGPPPSPEPTGPPPSPEPTSPEPTSPPPSPEPTSPPTSPEPTSPPPSPEPPSPEPTSPPPSPEPTSPEPTSPPPSPEPTPEVVIGTATHPIAAVNGPRPADALVVYTSSAGSTSPANQWGAEAAVIGGYVTILRDRQSGDASATPIPAAGVLLSGHGSARTWLLQNARVGVFVRLPDSLTPPGWPTEPPIGPCPAGSVELTFDDGPSSATTAAILDILDVEEVSATFYVTGRNAATRPDLVLREFAEGHTVGNHTWSHSDLTAVTDQTTTPTNGWGAEVAVSGSTVVAIDDRLTSGGSAMDIPSDGYVLSGHGDARGWLLAHFAVGDTVELPVEARSMAGQQVTRGTSTHIVSSVNADRLGNQLVVYTPMAADERILDELSRTSDLIASITGQRVALWRPPNSRHNVHIVELAGSLGLSMRLFDVDSMDWSGGMTPEQVTAKVLAGAHDGAVVDLHDTGPMTVDALPGIIVGLRNAGYCLS